MQHFVNLFFLFFLLYRAKDLQKAAEGEEDLKMFGTHVRQQNHDNKIHINNTPVLTFL